MQCGSALEIIDLSDLYEEFGLVLCSPIYQSIHPSIHQKLSTEHLKK